MFKEYYLSTCTCPVVASQVFFIRINVTRKINGVIHASPIKANIFILLTFGLTLQQTLLRYHKQIWTWKI